MIFYFLGKHLLNHSNLSSLTLSHIYAANLKHLRFIIHDNTIFDDRDFILKSLRKFIEHFVHLTSFVLEFSRRYEGEYRLRNQMHALLERHLNRTVTVYPTVHDRACRFCFHTNQLDDDDDDDDETTTDNYRTFCGIPLFQKTNQRKSSLFFICK